MAAARRTHHGDVASTGLIEVWNDEVKRCIWLLFESARHGANSRRTGWLKQQRAAQGLALFCGCFA